MRAWLAALLVLGVAAPAEAKEPDEIEMDPDPVKAPPKQKKKKKKAKAKPKAKQQAPKPPPEPEPPPVVEPEPVVTVEAAVSADVEKPLPDAPVATATAAKPAKRRRLYVRAGFAHIAPLAQSRELELADIDGAASLAVENGPIAGSGASVSSANAFAMTVGYRIRPRLGIEIVLGAPFTVTFKATGTLATESLAPMALGIPTGVPPLGEQLGEAKAAPPLVTAVYELTQGKLRPYAGLGAAVLFAYDAKVTNPILTQVSQPEMKLSPAPGLVLQAGLDAHVTSRIYARLDVKFIAGMLARARVEHIQVQTPELPVFDTVEVGTAKMSVWVNPLIIQAGIGTDF